ncbi:hypothetical protein D3C86_2240630 [compost metagenome]
MSEPSVTTILLVASALNSRSISFTGRLTMLGLRLRSVENSRYEDASWVEIRSSVASPVAL